MKAKTILLAALLIPVSGAQARDSLGIFESWGAFRDSGTEARCYAIAEPVRGGRARGWKPFAAVGTWPRRNVRGQVHFRLSQEVRKDAAVTLGIGDRRFALIAGKADAWAADKRGDATIIAAIRSGTSMSVNAVAASGRPFTDVYALRGAATAIDAAALGCAQIR